MQEEAAQAMAARWRARRALAAWRSYAVQRREGRLATLRACSVRFSGAAAAHEDTQTPVAGGPAAEVRAANWYLDNNSAAE